MTFQTERHAERLGVVNFVHLINAPVTFHAAQAAIHVNGVIEINVVGKFMDLNPLNRLAARRALTHQRQPRIVFQHLIVTVHTGGGGGNIREPGFLHARMAITAIHPKLPRVDRMGKSHRLNRLITDAGVFGSEVIPDARRDSRADQEHADDDVQRQPIGPFWENR